MSFIEKLCDLPDLEAELFGLLEQIPAGRVTTYGLLARALGDPQARAARWVGELLKTHTHSAGCWCYRVIRSNGQIGHYVTGNPDEKAQRLVGEGISVSEIGVVDLSFLFAEFTSSRPLEKLKAFQLQLASQCRLASERAMPRTVAGVDVAYRSDGMAVGAYVECSVETGEVIAEQSICRPVRFPYLPGYLSFRELPVLLSLLDQVRLNGSLAELIFVDGNGILHPWRAGIATCLGVLTDLPTIGVGKSLLCGSVDLKGMTSEEARYVEHAGEHIGIALKTKPTSKSIYVSPGHLIDLQTAAQLARRLMTHHRLPEPIHFADRLTKKLRVDSPSS